MPPKAHIQHSFHKAASTYDTHALLQRQVASRLFKETIDLLPDSARVLDAGCGTGYFHELARSHGKRFALYQLDLAFGMCCYADAYASPPAYGGTYTINGDIEQLPLASNTINAIFSSLVLQWADGLDAAFAECYRVLQPSGYFCFTTLLPGTLSELELAFSHIDNVQHIHRFVPEDMLLLTLEQAGFTRIHHHLHTYTLYYPTVYALLNALKAIGASHKGGGGMLNKTKLKQLNTYYPTDEKGIKASWQVASLIARK